MKTNSILAIMKSLPFNYLLIASMTTTMMMTTSISAFQSSLLSSNHPLHRSSILRPTPTFVKHHRSDVRILLEMAAAGDGNEDGSSSGSKQRRRKRKKSSDSIGDVVAATTPTDDSDDVDDDEMTTTKQPSAKVLVQEILAREQMMNYDEYEDLTSFTPVRLEEDDRIAAAAQRAGYSISGSSSEDVTNRGVLSGGSGGTQLEDLFDSREFLQRKREKQIEENAASTLASTGVPTKKKIKRSDIKAYNKLLEMDPIADEDDSYFEDEGIDFISALLGDVEPGVGNDSDESSNKTGKKVQKKTSFLGIGSGPLQVGHFIGALGVILMAFVEYPGFPLTNLPDPLRASLQEGMLCLYRCLPNPYSFNEPLISKSSIRTRNNLPSQLHPCCFRFHVRPVS